MSSNQRARTGLSTPEPGILEVRGIYDVVAQDASRQPRLLVPIPRSYREQVPLTFEMRTDPRDRLTNVRLFEDQPGNWIAEVTFGCLTPGDAFRFEWHSLVLCGPRSFVDLPARAPRPAEWPEDVRQWLASTTCCQSKHKRIRRAVAGIKGDDVLARVHETIRVARMIRAGQRGRCENLDAVEALDRQGSCTSNANLMTALFRAQGIPTRILAGYATWAGPHQTHFIVEIFVPDYGWFPIESTVLDSAWQPYNQMLVSIVPAEYEDERSTLRLFAGGGVPFLSLTEYPEQDAAFICNGAADRKYSCDHSAEIVGTFPSDTPIVAWQRIGELARELWEEWLWSEPQCDANHELVAPLHAETILSLDPSDLGRILQRRS